MERVDKFFRNISKDLKSASSSSESPYSFSGKEGLATALSSSDQSRVLMTRPNRYFQFPYLGSLKFSILPLNRSTLRGNS